MRKRKKRADYQSLTDGDLRRPMGLSEFMNGLGLVMRLPQKRSLTPEPEPAESEQEQPRAARSTVLVISVALFFVTALGILTSVLLPKRNDPMPTQLLGSWHATSPRYAGRAMEFREGALLMKRGHDDSDVVRVPIQRIIVRPHNSSQSVQIEYTEDSARLTLNLLLHDYGGMAVVELQNLPDVVWRKAVATLPNTPAATQPTTDSR